MGRSDLLLGSDEVTLARVRCHGKALVGPALVLVVCLAVLGAGLGLMPAEFDPWGNWVLAALVLAGIIAGALVPWLQWLTTTVTITDRRVITRRGILVQKGHDISWSRVTDVSYERSVIDRMVGCGTLVLVTAAERPVVLDDLPRIGEIHRIVTQTLLDLDDRRGDPTGGWRDDASWRESARWGDEPTLWERN